MEPQVRRDLSGRSRSLVRSRDWGMAGPSSIHRPAPGGPGEAVTVPQAPPPRPRSREGTFSEGVPECQRGVPREDRGSFRVGPGKVPPRATQSLPAPCSPCARTATGSPPSGPHMDAVPVRSQPWGPARPQPPHMHAAGATWSCFLSAKHCASTFHRRPCTTWKTPYSG